MISDRATKSVRLSVLKVKGGVASDVVVCSDTVFGFTTHWIDDRSWACGGDLCPACMQGVHVRWVGFYPVIPMGDERRRVMLLELSSTAYDRFRGLLRMEDYKTTAGVAVTVSRKKRNSPLVCEPIGTADANLLKSLDKSSVWSAIAALYSLPPVKDDETIEAWSQRCETVAAGQIKRVIA